MKTILLRGEMSWSHVLLFVALLIYLAAVPFAVAWLFVQIDPPVEEWKTERAINRSQLRKWRAVRQKFLLIIFAPLLFIAILHWLLTYAWN